MSNLCYYNDGYIHVKGNLTVQSTGTAAIRNKRNKNVMFKNCALFTNCISEINHTELDYAHDIDAVMPTYNLIEYSDIYSKTSGSL